MGDAKKLRATDVDHKLWVKHPLVLVLLTHVP